MRMAKPPAGYGRWTLELLADEVMALEVVDAISYETVCNTPKNGIAKRKIEYLVTAPEHDDGFVAFLEEVPETYAQAYDPRQPAQYVNEQPVELLTETRDPIPPTKKHPGV